MQNYHSATSSCDSFYLGYFSSSGYFQWHPVYCSSVDQGCAFMAAIYILGTVTVLAVNLDRLLPTLQLVFSSTFSQTAAVGGFAGATIRWQFKTVSRAEFLQ